jgi:hypothetical protein
MLAMQKIGEGNRCGPAVPCPIYRGMASARFAGRILAGGGSLVAGATLVAGGALEPAAPLAGAAVEFGPLVAGEASESAAPLAAGDVEAGPFAVGGAPVLAVPLVVAGVAAGPAAVAGLAFGVPFWAARCTGILLKNASHVGESSARCVLRHLMTLPFSLETPLQSFCASGPQEARSALSVTARPGGRLSVGGPGLWVFSEVGASPRAGRAAATRAVHADDNSLRWDERHRIRRPSPGCTPLQNRCKSSPQSMRTPRAGRAAKREIHSDDSSLRWDERHWIRRPSPGCTPLQNRCKS